ncbi:MAG TPA: hypothetical protein PLR88_01020 [Bacteroidales bacterium]|nr:hypothetical protein [Bacteroidales bacterium]HPT20499.1 hypothetical protein [Bacteroidales bacterium]
MEIDKIKEKYIKAAEDFSILAAKEEKLLILLSALRFLSFAGGFTIIWLLFTVNIVAGFLSVLAVIILFFYLLKMYSVHSDRKDFFNNLSDINRNEANAVSGNLSSFEAGNSYIDTGHDFSHDVDLFGTSSLFQYLNRTITGYGRDILAGWISDPFSLSQKLILRQEVVRELAGKEKWRQEFMASGMKKPLEKSDVTSLLKWIGEDGFVKSSPFRKILIYALPTVTILSLLMLISGILPYSVFIFLFFMNLFFIALGLKKTNGIHDALSRKYKYLSSMNVLLKSFEDESFTSQLLTDIKINISGGKETAAVSVSRLSRLIQAFDSRMNLLVGFVLNGLLLWDYHCVYKLEKWKTEYRELFPAWLEMLGQVDAYISLGNYAYNNQNFKYPVISDNYLLSARDMGHPLIEEKERVCNDFVLEKHGHLCIISGANMAGKSTFLRTVAVNFILAMGGAPVCASEMRFTPVKLFTSMRTTDSLSGNESYFYAELKRLKMLKMRIEKKDPVLFILDEILKGTNSADKSLGSKLFLKRLVELGGSGMIATHDTSLGEMENDFPGVVTNKCFEIEICGDQIKFDYKLQNGITHTMNAALLMKQMGIID